jgi:two-component system sensor histidine kinase EvgS
MSEPNADRPAPALPIWDRQAALDAVGGDSEMARMLLDQLSAQLPDDLAELHRLLADGHLPELADKAHRIRGGAVYCGVTALVAALTSLDLSAKAGDAACARIALDRVVHEIGRLRDEIGK